MSDPFVSIVVVNFNGKRFLDECLGSLARLNFPRDRYEVILIDNASSDGSVEHVRENHPWVRVVRLPENLGFAGGNNHGFLQAQGDFIALLNNDATAEPNWLGPLVDALQRDSRVGGAGSKILLREDICRLQSTGLVLYRNGSGGDRGFRELDRAQFDGQRRVFGCCGASLLLRREMLDEVGPFDPTLFMYGEDLDLAWRARLRGWNFEYVPESRILHELGGTSKVGSPFFVYHDERNRVLVNWKNGPLDLAIGVTASFLWRLARALPAFATRDTAGRVRARALVRAALSLCRRIGPTLRERRRIRGGAIVGDGEIRAWMQTWVRPEGNYLARDNSSR